MPKSESRRTFIGSSAVIGAGLALGAFTKASLAAEPKTKLVNAFIGRSDKQLDDAQIRALVVGQTLVGVTHKGSEYFAYVKKDGSVEKRVDTRRETGRWEIKDGKLFFRFPTLANGKTFELQVYKYKNGDLYKGWSPTETRWTWFVIEPGKAKELA